VTSRRQRSDNAVSFNSKSTDVGGRGRWQLGVWDAHTQIHLCGQRDRGQYGWGTGQALSPTSVTSAAAR
jgi:hypothetical protein